MTLLTAYLVCSGVAIVNAFLFAFQTWENRRFARSRTTKPQIEGQNARVALIAPCKGLDLELAANIERLFEQDYANYELLLAVDSPDDPAFPLLQSLVSRHRDRRRDGGHPPAAPGSPSAARIVIAGPASRSSQKIHNLRAAVAGLGSEVEVLAFVDSDTRPGCEWLRQLVRRLRPGGADAAMSYRWFAPLSGRLPNLLLASLDHSLAPLAGPSRHHLVWGGSWAIRRETFDKIGVDAAWATALSDDLVASRLLARARAKVEYEPAAMVASPIDLSWREMFHFLRRQYLVARWHEPLGWLIGLAVALANQSFFWTSLVVGVILAARGRPAAWAPLATVAVLYGWNVYRAWLRQSAARSFLPEWHDRLTVARWFDIALHPLAALLNCGGLLASALQRNVLWRGIHYAPLQAGAVRILPSAAEDEIATYALGPWRANDADLADHERSARRAA